MCLIASTPFTMVDAWLSVQSLFGWWYPTTVAGYAMAIVVGLALTTFAITLPIFPAYRTSLTLRGARAPAGV